MNILNKIVILSRISKYAIDGVHSLFTHLMYVGSVS